MVDKEEYKERDERMRKQIGENARIVLEIVKKHKTKENGDDV